MVRHFIVLSILAFAPSVSDQLRPLNHPLHQALYQMDWNSGEPGNQGDSVSETRFDERHKMPDRLSHRGSGRCNGRTPCA